VQNGSFAEASSSEGKVSRRIGTGLNPKPSAGQVSLISLESAADYRDPGVPRKKLPEAAPWGSFSAAYATACTPRLCATSTAGRALAVLATQRSLSRPRSLRRRRLAHRGHDDEQGCDRGLEPGEGRRHTGRCPGMEWGYAGPGDRR
jgi:hypothetical protein